MKKFTKSLFRVLFFAVISMTLLINTGCEKDEDLDEILGTWVLHEGEMTSDGVTVTLTPAAMGLSIDVTFEDDFTYNANYTETGYTPETESGIWVRTNSTSVTITATTNTEGPTTLTKDGNYYVVTDTEDGMTVKMKFKKQ
jgi:hypothetical protein